MAHSSQMAPQRVIHYTLTWAFVSVVNKMTGLSCDYSLLHGVKLSELSLVSAFPHIPS